MFRGLTVTVSAVTRLFRRLRVSRSRMAVTVGVMMLAGTIEGATVGMLVPLLSMLTGRETPASGFLAQVLPFLTSLGSGARVLVIATTILVLVVLKNLLVYAGTRLGGGLRASALIELRRQLLERVLGAPPATLERHTSGEISGAFLSEAILVNRALDYMVALVQRALMAFGYFMAVLLLSWQLTVFTFLLGVLLGGASMTLARRTLRVGRELSNANLELGRQISETVGGLRVVRSTASEERRETAFEEWNRAHALRELDTQVAQSVAFGVTESLGVLGAMITTGVAYAWVSAGSMDVSRFLAFAFGLVRLLPALNHVYGMHSAITSLTGSIEKSLEWLDLPRYPTRPFGERSFRALDVGVAFENVSFTYPGGHEAIHSMSFELNAGETIAVLGASGSGKSTLASLLLRLCEPTRGRILFDGVDYWEFERKGFHRAVALVEQEPFLFNASIAENVTFGVDGVGRKEILHALERVRLGDLIERLPQGIDTIIGERGATLSGGQRQRLALARAIVRDPQVLVLDEPTSALDSETEKDVVAAIEAVTPGRITVIITHRPSTVLHADRTLRIANGRLEAVEGRPRYERAAAGDRGS